MNRTMKLLRIYSDEAAYFGDRRVFEVIALRALDARLDGLTVVQALTGFGRSAHMHRRHVLEEDRSVVIEIVDEETRLRAFVQRLADLPDIGLITIEAVEILRAGGNTRHRATPLI
jgi:PII-like signaling protein